MVTTNQVCIDSSNEGWFVSDYGERLYRIDYNTDTISYIAMLPNRRRNTYCVNDCIVYKDYVYCISNQRKHICIYDKTENRFEFINLEHLNLPKQVKFRYLKSILYKDKIYVVYGGYNKIIELDAELKKLAAHYSIDIPYITNYTRDDALYHNKWYIMLAEKNTILEFDLEQKERKIINLDCIPERVYTISIVNGSLWLGGVSRNIYQVDINSHTIVEVLQIPEEYGMKYQSCSKICNGCKDICLNYLFSSSVVIDHEIWLIPAMFGDIVVLNTENKKIYSIGKLDVCDENGCLRAWKVGLRDNRYIEICTKEIYQNIVIDTIGKTLIDKTVVYDDESKKSYIVDLIRENKILEETHYIGCRDILGVLDMFDIQLQCLRGQEKGKLIYQTIKSM